MDPNNETRRWRMEASLSGISSGLRRRVLHLDLPISMGILLSLALGRTSRVAPVAQNYHSLHGRADSRAALSVS